MAAGENVGKNVGSERCFGVTGSVDDFLDILPRCEMDDEPQSQVRVVNVNKIIVSK